MLSYVLLRGVKKSQCNITRERLPITYSILSRIIKLLTKGELGIYDGLMLASASSMAFFGFLRCGEFTVRDNKSTEKDFITISDVKFTETGSYTLNLKNSKADVFRTGVQVSIHATETPECPYKLMSEYLHLRTASGAKPGDPLFISSKGLILQRKFYIESIKIMLDSLGLDSSKYSGHSLRIGASTTAAAAQIPDHLIKTLGRWSSNCYLRYIRTDPESIRRAQHRMCAI